MTRVVHLPIPMTPDTLVVVSATLREYVALSRDGGYLHHVRPARLEEPVVGDGKRAAGALTCDCSGGRARGTCYWTDRAAAFESARTVDAPSWALPRVALEQGTATFDAPVGAGEMVEASRG